MAEFIVNPRRAPRAPARCRAAIVSPRGRFEAETEDIGSMGCQVVSPELVKAGDAIQLLITSEKVVEPLQVAGRVAWVSPQPPWRAGVAFEERSLPAAARWFDQLLAAHPGLGNHGRVPDRIPTDATVYLGQPPRFLLDFTDDEAVLLRAIASGARIDELVARLRDRWPAAQRALFSLIARQAVTLQRGQAVHPDSWKRILTDIEASLAVESLGKDGVAAPLAPPRAPPASSGVAAPAALPVAPPAPEVRFSGTPPPLVSAAAMTHERLAPAATHPPAARAERSAPAGWSGAAPQDATRVVDLQQDEEGPLELSTPAPGPAGSRNAPHPPAAPHDPAGAPAGGRRPSRRNADAQAAFDRGLSELRNGNATGAITFLRIALTLAPGDREIAEQLGKVAFGGRSPGGR